VKVSFVQPRPELQPYIRAFWVLESAIGMPQTNANLVAPNGCPKIIILFQTQCREIHGVDLLVATVRPRFQPPPKARYSPNRLVVTDV